MEPRKISLENLRWGNTASWSLCSLGAKAILSNPGSPIELEVVSKDPSGSVLARGFGLRQAFLRKTATFEVDTSQNPGRAVEVKIYGQCLRVY